MAGTQSLYEFPASQRIMTLSFGQRLLSLLFALIAGVFSYQFVPLYSVGDGAVYLEFYERTEKLDLFATLAYQLVQLSSAEPIHAISVWLFSKLISHELYIGITSFFLALILSRTLFYLRYGALFVTTLVLTNSYLLVLYLPGERLKLAFILFLFGLNLLFSSKTRLGAAFMFLSMMAHVQMILFLFCAVAFFFGDVLKRILATGRIRVGYVVALLGMMVLLISFSSYIINKVSHYFQNAQMGSSITISDFAKPGAFMLMSLFSTFQKRAVIFAFLPLILAAGVVSSDRVTMVAYFLFLFFASNSGKQMKLILLLLSGYYAAKGVAMINTVIIYGTAFPDATDLPLVR